MRTNRGRSVKRTQIQLDDATYEAVRRRAYEQNRSMASVVREALAKAFGVESGVEKRKWTIEDFPFIGMGSAGTTLAVTTVPAGATRGCRHRARSRCSPR